MKTKNLIHLAVILVSTAAITFTSCTKDDLNTGTIDPASLVQLSADENNVESLQLQCHTHVGDMIPKMFTTVYSLAGSAD